MRTLYISTEFSDKNAEFCIAFDEKATLSKAETFSTFVLQSALF